MNIPRILISIALLVSPAVASGQSERGGGDFGSKFFDDLRILFGRLQQSELDRAFQRASAVHCTDLVGQTGDWKQVAFLNDDRRLGDWHHESIDEVKRDPTKFVFSGVCRGDRGPVRVATSYPIAETMRTRSLQMRDNDPVSVIFDPPSDSYIFQLPYLYLSGRDEMGSLYTLFPPTAMSRPEKDVAEEFRCKTLSDRDLTYRFLLCRTHLVDRDAQMQRLNSAKQPLGNAAYYILSDGKEAGSTVKLTFGPDVIADKEAATPLPSPVRPPARENPVPEWHHPEAVWQAPEPQARLFEVGQGEFRLRFDPKTWSGHIRSTQSLTSKTLSESARTAPPRNAEYCAWRPVASVDVDRLLQSPSSAENAFVYSLSFKKDLQSVTSATFDVDNGEGTRVGSLQCYFPQSQNPADITVLRLQAIVGTNIILEVRQQ